MTQNMIDIKGAGDRLSNPNPNPNPNPSPNPNPYPNQASSLAARRRRPYWRSVRTRSR